MHASMQNGRKTVYDDDDECKAIEDTVKEEYILTLKTCKETDSAMKRRRYKGEQQKDGISFPLYHGLFCIERYFPVCLFPH